MATYNGADKRLAYLFENGGGGGGGTTVVANPAGDATDMLKKLQVGSDIYSVLNEGGLAVTYHANWTATASSTSGTKLTQELTIPKGKYIIVAHNAYSTNANVEIFGLSVNGSLDNSKIIKTPISYGGAAFFLDAQATTAVAYASATGNSLSWDAAYINRGGMDIIALPDALYLPEIYSTEERQIGVWINGKPLYQRTYTGNWSISPNSAWYNTNIDITNVEFLVDGWCGAPTFKNNYAVLKSNNKLNVTSIYSVGGSLGVTQITIQYTKTTDVAGSGIYTPSGARAVHYSTDEQIIGTWLGDTLYAKVFDLGSDFGISNTELTNTSIDATNMKAVINARAVFSTGVTVYQVMANINNNLIRLQADRNNVAISARYIYLEYTKNT